MYVDVVKDLFRAQIKDLHHGRLENQLLGLADEELSDGQELLSSKLLVSVVYRTWHVS